MSPIRPEVFPMSMHLPTFKLPLVVGPILKFQNSFPFNFIVISLPFKLSLVQNSITKICFNSNLIRFKVIFFSTIQIKLIHVHISLFLIILNKSYTTSLVTLFQIKFMVQFRQSINPFPTNRYSFFFDLQLPISRSFVILNIANIDKPIRPDYSPSALSNAILDSTFIVKSLKCVDNAFTRFRCAF